MASVEERVKQIIVEQLGVDEGEVTPTASFVDDLGADSLDTVELVMAFEEAFGIEIPDEDAEKIATVKDAVDYIEKHSKQQVVGPQGVPFFTGVVPFESPCRRYRRRAGLRLRDRHRRSVEQLAGGQERDWSDHRSLTPRGSIAGLQAKYAASIR